MDRRFKQLNMRMGVAIATPSVYAPTISSVPSLARTMSTAHWQNPFQTVPATIHMRFEPRLWPAGCRAFLRSERLAAPPGIACSGEITEVRACAGVIIRPACDIDPAGDARKPRKRL